MNNVKDFQSRAAYAVLTSVIVATVKKVSRFRDVPTEDIVSESFSAITKANENRQARA